MNKKIAIISHIECLKHEMGSEHPERPERIRCINDALVNCTYAPFFTFLEAPLAQYDQLVRVHDEPYVDYLFRMSPRHDYFFLDPDTAMNPYTVNAALRAAGSVIYAVDQVMKGAFSQAFCNIRPPGHHAEHNKAMGFCFFNNVAIGVAHALAQHHLKRIVIIDFDVHHGNGTEDIFKGDERILFCSSFQHPFYPGTQLHPEYTNVIHMPLTADSQPDQFRTNWQDVLEKVRVFQPELIFISAGFDGHIDDPLAQLNLRETDYSWLTTAIKALALDFAQGRIISVLEGGYDLNALARCAIAHVTSLL